MTFNEKVEIAQCYCDEYPECVNCPAEHVADSFCGKSTFENLDEGTLDRFIEIFEGDKLEEKTVSMPVEDYTRLAEKQNRCQYLCDSIAQCENCPCRELAKEAGTATLCCFEDMDDAMLDKYLAKFSDAATLSEAATLSGGGCSGHKVAPPTETSLKDAIHPHHYKLPCGMQVVDVEVAMFGREAVMAHCLCTAAEYILRSQQKNGVEDIKKAHWWLCEYLELEAEGHGK